ncbi:MAG: CoA-binding protein [Rhodospirillales bacterium RIFCSPLOWO2_12_FULL_58_28]|nr:MAG: CoA-binding protein [Rhodospirillales bacterium RIFCSPLOWO2_02_FULL_58_16]OHC78507.1 MAG: CoA-binding protein [Rhodospirillales bacterium RIFCSPLOWO2_12_FULL_58_28]
MKNRGIEEFKYFVGIRSLGDIASKDDRICVLNILGGESRTVTPISHAYSGGNVVFGTSPGRQGQVLETRIGNIPVYNSVREGLKDGHKFNVGVVYLPPAGVRDGVAELIRVNPNLTKIIIITEKVSTHDAREIRALGQQGQVDIFGANCLGIADAWLQVRYGGALGGDHPAETLRKGCVAIYSNSGNFTTTIANYLKTGGWGTTTSVSSGKDVYIHFGAAEFANALTNDPRSKAAVMYVEPGGYYEQELKLTKPTVACVVGRWKANLTRAVGHAGAIGGTGDSAVAKEGWFKDRFGVDDLFTPENPVCSAKGAVVANIAYIPAALTAVMTLNKIKPDFPPEGDLSLKPWFGNNQGLNLPADLDLPIVDAISPYREQIAELDKQVGAFFPRQPMKDCSGSSIMDATSQITRVNGVSILDTAKMPMESNLCLNLVREANDDNDNALFNLAVASEVNLHGDAILAAAQAASDAGNAPNSVLATACAILGPGRVDGARKAAETLVELFAHSGVNQGDDENADFSSIKADALQLACLLGDKQDAKAKAMLAAFDARGARSVFVKYLRSLKGHITADAVLAALTTTIAWEPLMRKRISTLTVRNLPWYARLFAVHIGASTAADDHGKNSFCGVAMTEIMASWTVTELAYLALTGKKPSADELFPFQVMMGLIISNGVGTISAQGAKGAVSADGPESPERVQINKCMVGFLTHTGFAHGGNGFEGIQFLIECFRDKGLTDAGDPNHGIDLKAMAEEYALAFGKDKKVRKAVGEPIRNIPGVNHPVFKGLMVNKDPREVFIAELLKGRGDSNVFHDYYSVLVKALFDTGMTKNIFCVNIDAVIATILLKLLWPRYQSGDFSEKSMETSAFTAFLFGRMAGCAGEIDDHINRGRNMDTRTPTSQCRFVS